MFFGVFCHHLCNSKPDNKWNSKKQQWNTKRSWSVYPAERKVTTTINSLLLYMFLSPQTILKHQFLSLQQPVSIIPARHRILCPTHPFFFLIYVVEDKIHHCLYSCELVHVSVKMLMKKKKTVISEILVEWNIVNDGLFRFLPQNYMSWTVLSILSHLIPQIQLTRTATLK